MSARDRDMWTAVLCQGAMEYSAESDLRRLGIPVYLPQHKRKWQPVGATSPMLRFSPLFKNYLLVPVAHARRRELHFVRYLRQPKHLLTSAEGVIWSIGVDVVDEIMRLEQSGHFDEVEPVLGDKVRLRSTGALAGLDLFVSSVDDKIARMFSPMLGGARVSAKVADLARAG